MSLYPEESLLALRTISLIGFITTEFPLPEQCTKILEKPKSQINWWNMHSKIIVRRKEKFDLTTIKWIKLSTNKVIIMLFYQWYISNTLTQKKIGRNIFLPMWPYQKIWLNYGVFIRRLCNYSIMSGLCKVMELALGESVINGATPCKCSSWIYYEHSVFWFSFLDKG